MFRRPAQAEDSPRVQAEKLVNEFDEYAGGEYVEPFDPSAPSSQWNVTQTPKKAEEQPAAQEDELMEPDWQFIERSLKMAAPVAGLGYIVKDAGSLPIIGPVSNALFSPAGSFVVFGLPILVICLAPKAQQRYQGWQALIVIALSIPFIQFIHPVIDNVPSNQGFLGPTGEESERHYASSSSSSTPD